MKSVNHKLIALTLLCAAVITIGCMEEESKVISTGSGKSTPDKMVASGVITGLGPIQVSGTSLAEANTKMLLNAASNRNANDLRLGMTADITGTIVNLTGVGDATFVLAQNAVRGRVGFIDNVNRMINVQSVLIGLDQNTIFEGTNGQLGGASITTAGTFRAINIGDVVEVYGITSLPSALMRHQY